ncbi:shikimate kinase [Sedimentibacter sp. zth1]|nr:shikimate kinase [Sedimentibacter sp. zth1]
MPGSGKSTIGYRLSKILDVNFVDVDNYIEKKEKNTISGLFENGEKYFRNIESKCIEEISILNNTIIATGGGAVTNKANMVLLKQNSIIIYINRDIKTIMCSIDDSTRPLLKNKKEKLYALYIEREPLYKKYGDFEVKNDKDIQSTINQILEIIKEEEII